MVVEKRSEGDACAPEDWSAFEDFWIAVNRLAEHGEASLQHSIDTLIRDDVQKFEGWSGGPGVALFPLAHR